MAHKHKNVTNLGKDWFVNFTTITAIIFKILFTEYPQEGENRLVDMIVSSTCS